MGASSVKGLRRERDNLRQRLEDEEANVKTLERSRAESERIFNERIDAARERTVIAEAKLDAST